MHRQHIGGLPCDQRSPYVRSILRNAEPNEEFAFMTVDGLCTPELKALPEYMDCVITEWDETKLPYILITYKKL